MCGDFAYVEARQTLRYKVAPPRPPHSLHIAGRVLIHSTTQLQEWKGSCRLPVTPILSTTLLSSAAHHPILTMHSPKPNTWTTAMCTPVRPLQSCSACVGLRLRTPPPCLCAPPCALQVAVPAGGSVSGMHVLCDDVWRGLAALRVHGSGQVLTGAADGGCGGPRQALTTNMVRACMRPPTCRVLLPRVRIAKAHASKSLCVVCACACGRVCALPLVCAHLCMCVLKCVCKCVCMSVCMCVWMRICVCLRAHMGIGKLSCTASRAVQFCRLKYRARSNGVSLTAQAYASIGTKK